MKIKKVISFLTLYPNWKLMTKNIIGNIIMFIPFPFCIYYKFKSFLSFKKILLSSFLCSLSIEILQFIESISG